MNDFVLIPYYKLSPDKITFFSRPDTLNYSERINTGYENLKLNQNRFNEISENSQKRLREKINIMMFLTKDKKITGRKTEKKYIEEEIVKIKKPEKNSQINYKLGLITLTLSGMQHNSDEEIKKELLGLFLQRLRDRYQIEHYIWKAEKQDNGNIHFHIIIDRFIKHTEIREIWNQVQNKKNFNYVDLYRTNQEKYYENGFRINEKSPDSVEIQKEKYEKKKIENFSNPNSTDIHSLKSIRNAAAYIAKYLGKDVTGTNRKLTMINLLIKIESTEKYIQKIRNCVIKYLKMRPEIDKIDRKLTENEMKLKEYNEEFEKLKAKGVSGRIYYCSQSLSRLSALTEVEEARNVPDFELLIDGSRKVTQFNVNNNPVTTIYNDINTTPNLRELFRQHLNEQMKKTEIKIRKKKENN